MKLKKYRSCTNKSKLSKKNLFKSYKNRKIYNIKKKKKGLNSFKKKWKSKE